jgi:hypothetical protein
MRIIYLLVVVLVISYLVTRQIEEVTPVEEATPAEEGGGGVIYGKELEKARGVEQIMQEQADKRLEEADKLAR